MKPECDAWLTMEQAESCLNILEKLVNSEIPGFAETLQCDDGEHIAVVFKQPAWDGFVDTYADILEGK